MQDGASYLHASYRCPTNVLHYHICIYIFRGCIISGHSPNWRSLHGGGDGPSRMVGKVVHALDHASRRVDDSHEGRGDLRKGGPQIRPKAGRRLCGFVRLVQNAVNMLRDRSRVDLIENVVDAHYYHDHESGGGDEKGGKDDKTDHDSPSRATFETYTTSFHRVAQESVRLLFTDWRRKTTTD